MDNVTPIGPHVTISATPVERQFIAAGEIVRHVEVQRDRIFAAMAIISLAEHSSPSDVSVGEPLVRFALREAYAILNAAAAALEDSHFEVTTHG